MNQKIDNHPTQFDRNRAWEIVNLIIDLESSDEWIKKSRQGKAFAVSELLYKFRMTDSKQNVMQD